MGPKEEKPPVPKEDLFDPFTDGTGKRQGGPDNWRDVPPPKERPIEEGEDSAS